MIVYESPFNYEGRLGAKPASAPSPPQNEGAIERMERMITPEQLAEAMQNERSKQNYLPKSDKAWECLNDYDQGVLAQIAAKVLNEIERHKECKCEEYPSMRQLAFDLKHVLDKYC